MEEFQAEKQPMEILPWGSGDTSQTQQGACHGWRRAIRDVVQWLWPLKRMSLHADRERSHEGDLSRGVTVSDMCYKKNILAAVWGWSDGTKSRGRGFYQETGVVVEGKS